MIKSLLSDSSFIFMAVVFLSIFSLAAAMSSEVFLGLEPCVLCIYQRWPFAIGAALGTIGFFVRKKIRAAQAVLCVMALNFFVNSGIAFYHTGVEQKWWASQVEGCAVPLFDTPDTSGQSILENLMSTPVADCSKIPWQDPVLGLSMANYNVMLCFGIAVVCFICAALQKSKAATKDYSSSSSESQ